MEKRSIKMKKDENKTKPENTSPVDSKPNKNKPFIPLAKQSKQKQKAYHTSNRTTWGILNPATRTPPNPKAYKRTKKSEICEE